jgi:hypothetical protein
MRGWVGVGNGEGRLRAGSPSGRGFGGVEEVRSAAQEPKGLWQKAFGFFYEVSKWGAMGYNGGVAGQPRKRTLKTAYGMILRCPL